jgi:DNA-binding NtrC family response regulator
MPGAGGIDVLRAIRTADLDCQVILMSGGATIDNAVEAIKLGAVDFLTKPLDLERFVQLLGTVREEISRREHLLKAESRAAQSAEFCGMIGRGPASQQLFDLIRRLAPHVRTALITGETGSGKELVARALYRTGPRRQQPFVVVNCSAVVEALFESELFGHVKGSYTGATETTPGLFELADGGTIFLDEVGELPLTVQAKLLRVLETGEVQRVGPPRRGAVDVHVLAATNRDLLAEVAAKRFRSDLYYRINVVELTVPPLRDRREDIPYLVAAFVRDAAARLRKPLLGLTPAAERQLMARAWDGNVRELRNTIERACILAEGGWVTERELKQSGSALPHNGTRRAGAGSRRRQWIRRWRRREAVGAGARPHPAGARAIRREQDGRGPRVGARPAHPLPPIGSLWAGVDRETRRQAWIRSLKAQRPPSGCSGSWWSPRRTAS